MPTPKPGANALLEAYARSFVENADALSGPAIATALDILRRLARLAYDDLAPLADPERAPDVIAAGQLHLVQAFICDNLNRADLSPETVARALRISPRQLHRLFQPSGMTFARYVLRKRTERVARCLAERSEGSIIDAAFACGFNGSSAFYRAFKKHYGLNPRDYRESLHGRMQPILIPQAEPNGGSPTVHDPDRAIASPAI